MDKLRVWWIPQTGMCDPFYIPVKTAIEGKKIMDLLAAYDAFQFENEIKPDYINTGGLEMWDKDENDWVDWGTETEDGYVNDLDEYFEFYSNNTEEVKEFSSELFSQVDFERIRELEKR